MRELIQGAGARGLKRMEGFVLAENSRMLGLARRLDFTVKTDPHDATVMIVPTVAFKKQIIASTLLQYHRPDGRRRLTRRAPGAPYRWLSR